MGHGMFSYIPDASMIGVSPSTTQPQMCDSQLTRESCRHSVLQLHCQRHVRCSLSHRRAG